MHRHPDIRWRQSPEKVEALAVLQGELLERAAAQAKPKGISVYATCTLNVGENERVVENFLRSHPQWCIQPPPPLSPAAPFAGAARWIKVLPHRHQMDGFFMVKLIRGE